MLTDKELFDYLAFAKALAADAGVIMKRYFGQKPDSHYKADQTIVTIADTEINQLVIDRVRATYPEHSVDGEEASDKTSSKFVWVCDPIDGTNTFAMELPLAVFSLALVVDGRPVVGVINDPFMDKLYAAGIGKGATVNDRPLKVSTLELKRKSRLNYDFWPDASFDILPSLTQLVKDTGVYMLSPGSVAHMCALVAEGQFVGCVFPGIEHRNVDIAAAKVIVEEAGGKVTDIRGREQRYDGDIYGAIISNGIVHAALVECLAEAKEIKR